MGDLIKGIISCCRNGAYLIHGYEAALIGVSDSNLPIYDYWKLVKITERRTNSTESAACTYVDNNIIRRLPSDKANGPIISYGMSGQADDQGGQDGQECQEAHPPPGLARAPAGAKAQAEGTNIYGAGKGGRRGMPRTVAAFTLPACRGGA